MNEYTTSATCAYRDSIDESAEREGIASLRLSVLTGIVQPVPGVLLKAIEASDPRARPTKPFRYPRQAFLKRWFAALYAIENRRPVPRTRLDFDTRADLVRRKSDRQTYGHTIRRQTPRGTHGRFVAA